MSLPNVLTYGRIVAVPALVACLFFLKGDVARWSAFVLFVLAGLTDWLDGYLARMWEQQSTLGRMLDPIADKLLVGAVLLMLVYDNTISGWSIWAAIIILLREILVSGLRLPHAGQIAAKTKEAAFLKRLHKGACNIFGTALGPELNEPHRNHFHFDMKQRRRRSVCR